MVEVSMNHLEIEACVINAKYGDSKEMEKLINQFRPFIFKTAKTYNIKNYDIDDLSQIGFTALFNAVNKYNPGSHTFSSYAYNSVKNSLSYFARKNSKFNKELSINTRISSDSNITTEYIDCLEDTDNLEETFLKLENKKEILHYISKLPEDERDLINMLFYKKSTLKAYAEKTGLGYIQASRKKKRTLDKLKGYLS
jgi:RNA polymerase sporulation-specific sigma factor